MNIYIVILIFILSGIFMFLKHRKRFEGHFYHTLTDAQLKKEAKRLLLNILSCFDENSKFIHPKYKDINHLKSEVETLISHIDDTTLEGFPDLTSINRPDQVFTELAQINNWEKHKTKWIKELSLVFIETYIRQGLHPKN